jgi:hypothetical protein
MKIIVVAPKSFLRAVEGGASIKLVEHADRAGTLSQPIPSACKKTFQGNLLQARSPW